MSRRSRNKRQKYTVKEEASGVPWGPYGGDFVVLSHQTEATFPLIGGGTRQQEPNDRDSEYSAVTSLQLGQLALELLLDHAPDSTFSGIERSLADMGSEEWTSEFLRRAKGIVSG